MGILERSKHVIRADLNALLKKAKNPEVVLDAYLDDLEAVLEEAMSIRSAEEAEREVYAARLRDIQAAQKTWEKKALSCLGRGEEELARSALERKHDLRSDIESLSNELEQRTESLDILVSSVESLKERILEVNRKRRELRYRRQLLQARTELQDALSRVGQDGDEPVIEGAQDDLSALEGRLEAEEAMRQDNLDDKVLRMEVAERRRHRQQVIDQELDQMRRRLKRKKG
jgi:phage shock protein A